MWMNNKEWTSTSGTQKKVCITNYRHVVNEWHHLTLSCLRWILVFYYTCSVIGLATMLRKVVRAKDEAWGGCMHMARLSRRVLSGGSPGVGCMSPKTWRLTIAHLQ